MIIRAVLFDLDGTLLDTVDDLGGSMNTALEKMGYPGHPIEKYKVFVGDGMDVLAQRVLPSDAQDLENVKTCVAMMHEEYAQRCAVKTHPYDGINELLASLDKKNIRKSVLSNKPDAFTKKMVTHYFGNQFDIVYGGGVFPKKPDPAGPLAIASHMDLSVDQFLYLGDTNTDMQTACNSLMIPVGALWGFRSKQELLDNGAKYVIEHPVDLLEIITNC